MTDVAALQKRIKELEQELEKTQEEVETLLDDLFASLEAHAITMKRVQGLKDDLTWKMKNIDEILEEEPKVVSKMEEWGWR